MIYPNFFWQQISGETMPEGTYEEYKFYLPNNFITHYIHIKFSILSLLYSLFAYL